MPPAKRRKAEEPTGVSAFAARKKLLGLRSTNGVSNDEGTSAAEWSDDSLSSPDELNNEGTGSEMADVAVSRPLEIASPMPINFIFPSKNQIRKSAHGLEISIRDGESLKFPVIGSYSIAAEKKGGEATISGISLGSEINVHAPLCYSVPVIRCSGDVTIRLNPQASSPRSLDKLAPSFRGIWLGKESPFQIGYPGEKFPKKAPLQPLVVPAEWYKKIGEMMAPRMDVPMTALACGPKSSGKSTFSRILGNRVLSQSQVVLLDLDPGQPEFAPPGSLSLVLLSKPNISPPFTHPWADGDGASIIRCHALASITPGDNPDLYIDIATSLHELYREGYGHLPLIISTPGWILGTGLELLTTLITTLRPNHVIYMSKNGPEDALEKLGFACDGIGRQLALLPSRKSTLSPRTAAQLREMHTMSYFHYIKQAGGYVWSDQPLSRIRPLAIRYEGKRKGISAVVSYGPSKINEGLADAVNGMVLALVEIEDLRAFRREEWEELDDEQKGSDFEAWASQTPGGIPHLSIPSLDPNFSHMLGLALIQGVDHEEKKLHILTPLPTQPLNQVKRKGRHLVLVRGNFDPPFWSYTEDAHANAFRKRKAESDDDDDEEGGTEGFDRLPFLDVLAANEKRPTGSQALRIRRDIKK